MGRLLSNTINTLMDRKIMQMTATAMKKLMLLRTLKSLRFRSLYDIPLLLHPATVATASRAHTW